MSPTSHYFNHYPDPVTNEQRLMEDVVHESITMMGHDCYYIPREEFEESDFILGENVNSKFERAYRMAFYLANVQGYEGDGDFFSKFGLEIRETTNLIISRKEFERFVPTTIASRPREGDLVYVPVLSKLFEVKFIEEELMFFSLGNKQPYIYELRAEVFRFSHETVDTGVDVIDETIQKAAYTIKINVNKNSTNNYIIGETVYTGNTFATATAKGLIQNWSPTSNTLNLTNIVGTFSSNTILIGQQSNTRYRINSTEIFGNNAEFDLRNNKNFRDEANSFIDFSEKNPFGIPD